jgi:UDP-glucose 4-epimerase
MKFLVTGGAGYVGSHFVKVASEEGHSCLVYDSLERGHKQAITKGAELVVGNILDTKLLQSTIEKFKPDVLLHYAAYALVPESVKEPQMYFNNNVGGVASILTALENSSKHTPLVFSSTCAVFGTPKKLPMSEDDPKNPESPYGESKLQAEGLIKKHVEKLKVPSMAIRYFNACGAHPSGEIGEDHEPETHLIPNIFLAALAKKKVTLFGNDYPTKDGTCVRDYIHVMDLAVSHLRAAGFLTDKKTHPEFYTVHVGSGVGYSNLEVVKAVQRCLGDKIPLEYELAGRRPGDPAQLYADNSKAKKLLKFTPEFSSIDNIVQSAWNWHKKHPTGYPK